MAKPTADTIVILESWKRIIGSFLFEETLGIESKHNLT